MRNQSYRIQTQPNQFPQYNSTTFNSTSRQSIVSNQSNNSRKRIFQQPQYQMNNQIQVSLRQTSLKQSSFQSLPPKVNVNPNLQFPQANQLPPSHPNPSKLPPPPPNPHTNRVSQYSFKQPLNFQRKTLIKPSLNIQQASSSQINTINRTSNRDKNKSKMQALARLKYLNPLARLDYQDREMEVYTKISKKSQEQVMKKIKAKNQLANFQENEVDQEREIDDLIEFKLGKIGKNGFITYFEKQQSVILQQNISTKQYCTSCQSFILQPQYNSHIQTCKFEYSSDRGERNYQIQNKINKIYKLLLEEEEETKEGEILKECLIELNGCGDGKVLNGLKGNVEKLRCIGTLEVIAGRVLDLIKVKLSLL